MDGGAQLADLAGRFLLFALAAFLVVVAWTELRQAMRDLRLRLTGHRAEATVRAVLREWVAGETAQREWVHVGFSTDQGQRLEDVRLRHWTRLAPRPGARIPISYHPEDPTVADRALLRRALGRLLVSVPLTTATAVFSAGAATGLWDRWLRR